MSTQDARLALAGRLLPVGVLGLLVAFALLHALQLPNMPVFPMDDAYIVQHNVRALYRGLDTSFGGVPALTGSTSFLHFVLVALFAAVMPTGWACWLVGWLAIGLTAMAVLRLSRVHGLPLHMTLALSVLALGAGDAAYQHLNGIETGLAMAAVLWAVTLHCVPAPRASWLSPLVTGALPWVRPELALLSALLILEQAHRAPAGARLRVLARGALFALLAAVPGLLCYTLSTGFPVPRTGAIKRNFFAEGCAPLLDRLGFFGRGLWEFCRRLNLGALGLPLLLWSRVRFSAGLFVLGFCAAYVLALPGAAYHNNHRYLYPLLALSVLGPALVWSELAPRLRTALGVMTLLAALGAASGWTRTGVLYAQDLRLTNRGLAGVVRYIHRELPADVPLMVHDVGFVSDAVPNPLVDVVGLKDPRAAALHREVTWPSCGRDRARVFERLALERGARHFVVYSVWDEAFKLIAGLRALGWRAVPLRGHGVFYQVYRLEPPAGEAG